MYLSTLQNQTMSSREIAKLTSKEHRSILRDIDKLNETYEKLAMHKVVQGSYTLKSTGKQQHREFNLTKEQSLDLMTGYNAELRIKINRRWLELEQKEIDKLKWKEVRKGSKEKHKLMCDAINDEHNGSPKFYHFVNEAEMLNVIVFGMKSKQLKEYFGASEKQPVRDFMTVAQLDAYEYLQNMNAAFIAINMSKNERLAKLEELYIRKHKNKVIGELIKNLE